MDKFYYVIQTNTQTKETWLLGYNLNEQTKNKLFYSLGKNNDSAIFGSISNGYGCHNIKFNSNNEAERELITKPKKFNDALLLLKNYGYDVVKKGIVSKKVKVVSYQSENKKHFGV